MQRKTRSTSGRLRRKESERSILEESCDRRAPMSRASIPPHVHENIETISELVAFARPPGRHQRLIEWMTRRLGRPAAVYLLLTLVSVWGLYNAVAPSKGLPVLDAPPFPCLQGGMTVFAAVVALMVLTTQNRQIREAEQRDQLELQVNLLAEQKATKIVSLLEELRRDLPMVKNRKDRVAEAMQKEVDPKAVLKALESTMENEPGKK